MKIVSLQQLGDCPPGTIFSDCEPCIVKELYRLSDMIRDDDGRVIDFFYCSLLASFDTNKMHDEKLEDNELFKALRVCDGFGRWGLFEQDAQFAVYEQKDLEKLVLYLTGTEEQITEEERKHAEHIWSDSAKPREG